MRLICPNCDAQYEVDDSVIPDTGRDVQCSNCGHAWFQPGKYQPEAEGEDASEAELPDYEEGPDGGFDDVSVSVDKAEEVPGPAAEPSAPTPRSALDDDMLNVLREEAEREAKARREEGIADFEVQTDLALDAPPPAPVVEPEQMADLRNAEIDDRAASKSQHRRELLPDIEEINSTLTASSGRPITVEDQITAETARRRRGGFRMGFSISLIAAVLLLALYVLAPSLAVQFPVLNPVLSAYVSAVNEVRMWLDNLLRSSTEAMRG
jgi:predicted Zn finger-like uncharacterized protein